jgi:hypothetical protein
MTYADRSTDHTTDRTVPVAVINYHDQVRWGPIFAGLVVALSIQLVLSALGVAVGLTSIGESGAPRSDATGVGISVGIWSIISLLVSLFMGGWTTARAAGRMSRSVALLNGAILWASTLALSAWLLSSGVTGAFGIVASNAGSIIDQTQSSTPATPSALTAQQTRDLAGNAAKVSWSFVLGSLLGLVASLVGAMTGFRQHRLLPNERDQA